MRTILKCVSHVYLIDAHYFTNTEIVGAKERNRNFSFVFCCLPFLFCIPGEFCLLQFFGYCSSPSAFIAASCSLSFKSWY